MVWSPASIPPAGNRPASRRSANRCDLTGQRAGCELRDACDSSRGPEWKPALGGFPSPFRSGPGRLGGGDRGANPFRREQGCPSRVARAAQLSAAARTTSQGWKTPPAWSSTGSSGRNLVTPTRGQFQVLPELISFPGRKAVLAVTLKSCTGAGGELPQAATVSGRCPPPLKAALSCGAPRGRATPGSAGLLPYFNSCARPRGEGLAPDALYHPPPGAATGDDGAAAPPCIPRLRRTPLPGPGTAAVAVPPHPWSAGAPAVTIRERPLIIFGAVERFRIRPTRWRSASPSGLGGGRPRPGADRWCDPAPRRGTGGGTLADRQSPEPFRGTQLPRASGGRGAGEHQHDPFSGVAAAAPLRTKGELDAVPVAPVAATSSPTWPTQLAIEARSP